LGSRADQERLANATGKLVSELVPNLNPFWLKIYCNVSRIGKLENYKIAVIFRDITKGKQADDEQKILTQRKYDQ
jgi:hypothetical protein